jgi:hypothetical protein
MKQGFLSYKAATHIHRLDYLSNLFYRIGLVFSPSLDLYIGENILKLKREQHLTLYFLAAQNIIVKNDGTFQKFFAA